MSLVTRPGKINILDSHAVVIMADEYRHQAVCISEDILPDDADQAAHHLTACLEIFERIAERKLADGELAYDGRVWITSSDMIGCAPFAHQGRN